MNWNKKQWKSIVILFIALVICVPFFINVFFKIRDPFEIFVAEWSPGDALSFYAAITSAILAIFGISLTIQSSRKELQENIRNSMLPFIIIDFLETKTKQRDLFSNEVTEELSDPETANYIESPLKEIVFVIAQEKVIPNHYLSGHQRTIIENGGKRNVQIGKGLTITVHDMYVYVPLILENVGSGAAVSMRIGLNRVDSDSVRKYVKPIPLKVGDAIRVAIYSEDLKDDSTELGNYELEIFYYDIYGNRYRQSNLIQLCFEANKKFPYLRIETMQSQEIVNAID